MPAQEARGVPEPTAPFGPLCMNIDVRREAVKLVFRNVGACNMTQFITLRPAAVMIGAHGDPAVIRAAETVEQLCSHERVAEWLR